MTIVIIVDPPTEPPKHHEHCVVGIRANVDDFDDTDYSVEFVGRVERKEDKDEVTKYNTEPSEAFKLSTFFQNENDDVLGALLALEDNDLKKVKECHTNFVEVLKADGWHQLGDASDEWWTAFFEREIDD